MRLSPPSEIQVILRKIKNELGREVRFEGAEVEETENTHNACSGNSE